VRQGSSAAIGARALVVWLIIVAIESPHGAMRIIFLEPLLGAVGARQFAVLSGTALVYIIAYLLLGWIAPGNRRSLLAIGVGWALLTITFEISVGRFLGLSWARIASDYDVRHGGFLIFGLTAMAFAPLAVTGFQVTTLANQYRSARPPRRIVPRAGTVMIWRGFVLEMMSRS
jgi:hypothetical protein